MISLPKVQSYYLTANAPSCGIPSASSNPCWAILTVGSHSPTVSRRPTALLTSGMSQAVLECFHESAQASSRYPLEGKGHLCEAAFPEVSGKQDTSVPQSGIPSLY